MLPIPVSQITMSSREIAQLTDKRHDNVMRTIDYLHYEKFVIGLPQSEEVSNDGPGPLLIKQYRVEKRDSFVVVAQLSPEFTARLVDRWQELESQQIPKTLPEALRLAADLAERNAALENKIEADLPKVEFAMAVRRMEGSCKIGDFGKVIGIGRNKLFARMRADEILMADNMPYQRYIDQDFFVVVEQTPFTDRDGKSHPAFTTMVTGKGQVWLERKYRIANNCSDK